MQYLANADLIHRQIADTDVLISIGENVADFNGCITLNETCAFVWELLQSPQTPEALAQGLQQTYEVTYEQALTDVRDLLATLLDRGMVQEVAP